MNPATMKVLGNRLLVRRYERPEIHGSLVIPEQARTDYSQTLWSFVKAGTGVELDLKMEEGDILRTDVRTGIPLPGEDDLWLIPADTVDMVYKW